MKKYELTEEVNELENGTVLHRIRALRDMPNRGVAAGDIGGWIEKESNLEQAGDAWVSDNACVYGYAQVCAYGFPHRKCFCMSIEDFRGNFPEVLRNVQEEALGLNAPLRMLDLDKYMKWQMEGGAE